jgi:hypothetical protein
MILPRPVFRTPDHVASAVVYMPRTVMSLIMRRRSGLMVSSLIGGLPSRGEVGHPSILKTGPPPRHPNPFS